MGAALGQADHHDSGADRENAGAADQAGPLAEQQDPSQRGEHRAGTPADRIADGQVAEPVTELQEQEVACVQHPGAGQEQPVQAGQPRLRHERGHGDDRQVDAGHADREQPDEAGRARGRGLLAEQVPARVGDRGG